MILARRVALNGVQLDSLDNRILISAIDEAAGRDNISAVSLGAGDGQRITAKRRDTLDITVKFNLNIKNSDMAGRTALLNAINKWASGGGVLTVGHRSGQQLAVVLAQAPGGGDQYSWANEFTMVFRAYGVPFWEDVTATSQALEQDTSGSGSITMDCSAETIGNVTVQNKSGGEIDSVSVTVNGNEMTFTDLGLTNNAYLTIDHVTTGGACCLRARIGNTSVLALRSGADEFVMKPGANAISFSAEGDVIVTVSAKGRYL